MWWIFGVKKVKEPSPSLQESSDRTTKRGVTVDEKIKKLDNELTRYKDQIKKTRPGPAREAIKTRATRVLKQKRIYEGQRNMLYSQTFNLDQVGFAADEIKDARRTHYHSAFIKFTAKYVFSLVAPHGEKFESCELELIL